MLLRYVTQVGTILMTPYLHISAIILLSMPLPAWDRETKYVDAIIINHKDFLSRSKDFSFVTQTNAICQTRQTEKKT